MWNATWHNFNVILLTCGMNVQIHKIQNKSLINIDIKTIILQAY